MEPKSNNTVHVSFPCVHGAASGQLITISCFQVSEMKSLVKAVTGIDEESARRIIGASRYKEMDNRAALGVMISLSNPLFGGESYGLALALADKITRLGKGGPYSKIYATGKIPPDGCGRVESISEFERKLDLLNSQGEKGSLFVFSKDNLVEATETVKKKLDQLKVKEIECVAINHINDLRGKAWENETQTKNNGSGSKPFSIYQYVAILLISSVFVFFIWQQDRSRKNEDRVMNSEKATNIISGSSGKQKIKKNRPFLESKPVDGSAY